MAKKKVAIQTVDALSKLFSVDLELALQHLKCGDEVHLVVCRGQMLACPPNSRHDELACALCRSRLAQALRSPDLADIIVHEVQLSVLMKDLDIPDFADVEALKSFELDGVNYGMEAASSTITVLRDPRPNLATEQRLAKSNVMTAIALHRWFRDFLQKTSVDLLYVYNGRHSSEMPAIRAARELKVPFKTFDTAHDAQRFVLVDNTYFHDLEMKKAEILSIWNDSTPIEEKERVGERFFYDRRYGSVKQFSESRFARKQVRGELPISFDVAARNLVIFNSSEDEFAAVPGYRNPLYDNQMDGIDRILNDDRLSPNITIWIRVHPHLEGRDNSQTKALDCLEHPQLRVVGSSDKVDTYALMEHAEKVLTFGSSMGIESAYAQIPSILIGREPFESLGCCYIPESHDEVMQLLNDGTLKPLPQVGAIKYGYWMIAREHNYKVFDPRTQTINGHHIRPNLFLKSFTSFWWSRYGHAFRSIPRRVRDLFIANTTDTPEKR